MALRRFLFVYPKFLSSFLKKFSMLAFKDRAIDGKFLKANSIPPRVSAIIRSDKGFLGALCLLKCTECNLEYK